MYRICEMYRVFGQTETTLYVSWKFTYMMMCEEEDRVGWFSVGVNSELSIPNLGFGPFLEFCEMYRVL
jgi:hypothetical protein